MDENLSIIRASAAAITGARGDLARVRRLRFDKTGFERETWIAMCELGWLGLRLPEARGGAGLGMAECCVLMEELGAGLVPEPLVPAMAAVHFVEADDLEAVLSGRKIVMPAWQDETDLFPERDITRLEDGRIYGAKLFVPSASGADAFAVKLAQGIAIVDRDAEGMVISRDVHVDGSSSATIRFDGTAAVVVEHRDSVLPFEEATLATAAYLLGVARAAHELTLGYLNTRTQFGKLIGSFQALQHRAVDMAVQIVLLRASITRACKVLDGGSTEDARASAVSRAKARAGDVAMFVTRQAVQLHGGVGFTDEHDIGLYLRKAMTMANAFGSPVSHRLRYALSAFRDELQTSLE